MNSHTNRKKGLCDRKLQKTVKNSCFPCQMKDLENWLNSPYLIKQQLIWTIRRLILLMNSNLHGVAHFIVVLARERSSCFLLPLYTLMECFAFSFNIKLHKFKFKDHLCRTEVDYLNRR